MSPLVKRRLARKSERGTTVLIVVMVTTLVTAIGVYSVRNASFIDRAVGYSRQSAQTTALADLGTSVVIGEFGIKASALMEKVENEPETCVANRGLPAKCYRLFKEELEESTQQLSSEPLLMSTVYAGTDITETGSFGPTSDSFGDVFVEITEPGPTGRPVAGSDIGGTGTALKYTRVTLTTTGLVRPLDPAGNDDVCNENIAAVASKKVMRARVVVGPI